MANISFDCSKDDAKIIRAIARRSRDILLGLDVDRPALDIIMDITAVHCNGNPLRLGDMLKADDFNLMHDITGVARHLDRDTGKLGGCFSPRFSKRDAA